MVTAKSQSIPADVLAWTGEGWRFFPVVPNGKRPLINNWLERATSNVAVLGQWAREFPACNWGLVTGSGIIVIDSDGDAGRRTTKRLRAQGHLFRKTLTVLTGRDGGGRHRYYRVPKNLHVRNDRGRRLGPGLDVKANGGYVVFASSIHPSGRRYRFELPERPIAEAPQWLLEQLVDPLRIAEGGDGPAHSLIPEGQRTDTLLSLAGTMNRRGMSLSSIEAALLRENEERCRPPLAENKVQQIAADVVERYPKNPDALPSGEGDLEITRLSDELARPRVRVDWLWKGQLKPGSVSLLVSKPKTGKSTLARNLALAVARGEPFLGWNTKRGSVVYLCLEERKQDVTAIFRALGASEEPIHLAEFASMSQIKRAIERLRPALLIVDTLFHLIGVRDENSYAEMTTRLKPLVNLARRTGTHILCLHHSSKRAKAEVIDTPIGSTALAGKVDTLLYMRQTEEFRTLRTRQRFSDDLPEVVLKFDKHSKRVELGPTRSDMELADVAEQILALATEISQTEPEINQQLEGRTLYKRQALRDLVKEGKLVRTRSGKKGDPFRYAKV